MRAWASRNASIRGDRLLVTGSAAAWHGPGPVAPGGPGQKMPMSTRTKKEKHTTFNGSRIVVKTSTVRPVRPVRSTAMFLILVVQRSET